MSVVTVVPTVEASNVPPRIKLDVTDVGTSPSIFATTVTRLDPDGNIVPVRTNDGNPLTLTTSGANRIGTVYDYEMPLGAPVSYSTLESPTVVSAEVTVTAGPWLVHPGVPVLSMPFQVKSIGPRSRPVNRGVVRPMGRKYPVVQTDGARKSAEFNLQILTVSDDERAGLESLLEDSSILLLNIPYTKGWGVGPEYVSVGELVESRVGLLVDSWRVWDLPCTVVDRPVGGSQSERTYADLLEFSSYAAMQANYATYAALLAGP